MGEDQIRECFVVARQVFGFTVKPEDAFYDLGGDSVQALDLAMRVEKATGVEIDAFEMVNAGSLGSFFRGCSAHK